LALTSLLQFCGHEAGPRTIFTVDATCAYDISAFSFYGEEEAEVRTWPKSLLLLLSIFLIYLFIPLSTEA
jgi:hypothetical protein